MIILLILLLVGNLWAQDTLRLFHFDSIPVWTETQTQDTSKKKSYTHKSQLKWSGSKTIQIKAEKDFYLRQDLDLQIYGPIDSNWQLNALIRESDFPLQQGGNQVLLREVDQIYFEATSPQTRWRLGHSLYQSQDPEMWSTPLSFLGAQGEIKAANHFFSSGYGGTFSERIHQTLRGISGVQTGYFVNNSGLTPIEPYSETIHLNSKRLQAGIDYEIEYATGLLSFLPKTPIQGNDLIEVSYINYASDFSQSEFYSENQFRFKPIQLKTYYKHSTTKGRTQSGLPLTQAQKELINEGVYLDPSPLQSFSQPVDSLSLYWKKDSLWISIFEEAPPPLDTLFLVPFHRDPGGIYQLSAAIDSSGRESMYYSSSNTGFGGYSPGTPLLPGSEKQVLGISLALSRLTPFSISYQGETKKDSLNPKELNNHRLQLKLEKKISNKHTLQSQQYFQQKGSYEGNPVFTNHHWSQDWELPLQLRREEYFHHSQTWLYKPHQWIHQFQFSSVHFTKFNSDAYAGNYRLEKNSIKSPAHFAATQYLLQSDTLPKQMKSEVEALVSARFYEFLPYTSAQFQQKGPQETFLRQWDKRKVNTETGLQWEQNHWRGKSFVQTEQLLLSSHPLFTDSSIIHRYGLEANYQPHHQHQNKLQLSLNRHWLEENSYQEFFLIDLNRQFQKTGPRYEEALHFRQTQGLQLALRKKYERVPQGTGDVLYDPITEQFIENVDHGNYQFVGMERDTTLSYSRHRELSLEAQYLWNLGLFSTQKSGFFHDLVEELQYEWHSRDSAGTLLAFPHFISFDTEDLIEFNFRFQTRTQWNPLQGPFTVQWTQSWSQAQSSSYSNLKERSLSRKLDLFFSQEKRFALNPFAEWSLFQYPPDLDWKQWHTGALNRIYLPLDLATDLNTEWRLYLPQSTSLGTQNLLQQKHTLGFSLLKEITTLKAHYSLYFTDSQNERKPWSWTRGFKKGWGHQITTSLYANWSQNFFSDLSITATQFEESQPWVYKISANAKGVF